MKKMSKKRKETETLSESFAYMFTWILRALVTIYAVLILSVLPLYFEQGYTHIGTDKATFFKNATLSMARYIIPALVLSAIFSFIVRVSNRRKGNDIPLFPKLNIVDWFALAYGISVVISYLCTNYRETALWGTTGWYMGMVPQLTLIAIYFCVSRFLMGAKWMLYLCMTVSSAVFMLGCLNRFDIWPIPMENSGLPSYISTIGNLNWYCGYIVSVLFVGVGTLWLDSEMAKWQRVLLSGYVCLGFATLVIQGSDSGIFALAVVFAAMFVLSAKAKENGIMRRFWWVILLFALGCLMVFGVRVAFPERLNWTTGVIDLLTYSAIPVIMAIVAITGWWYAGQNSSKIVWRVAARGLCIAVPIALGVFVAMIVMNTQKPGSLGALSEKSIFTFNDQWGSSRGATWRYGIEVFKEQDVWHKLVGIGPDCMADYLYKDSSAGLRADVEKFFLNQRLTNAHNEMLTLLVNVGICGAVTFGGMILCLLKKLLGVVEENPRAASCGLCLLAYTANNLWSFQQSVSVATIFVVMGIGAYLLRQKNNELGHK